MQYPAISFKSFQGSKIMKYCMILQVYWLFQFLKDLAHDFPVFYENHQKTIYYCNKLYILALFENLFFSLELGMGRKAFKIKGEKNSGRRPQEAPIDPRRAQGEPRRSKDKRQKGNEKESPRSALWAPLGSSGLLWAPLGSSGLLWAPLGSSGLLCAPLGSSGLPWAPLGSLGSPSLMRSQDFTRSCSRSNACSYKCIFSRSGAWK